MDIKMNDTIKLSDGKIYLVCSKTTYMEETYIYLVDAENDQNQKLLKVNKETNQLIPVTDTNTLNSILPQLLDQGIKNAETFTKNNNE